MAKDISEEINEIMCKFDPMDLISEGAPKDEYSLEAGIVSDNLPGCKSLDETRRMIYDVFVRSFEFGGRIGEKSRYIHPGGAGKEEDYQKMSEEIYNLR